MARLQDFPSVTPASSDNLLIVQPQGQGLAKIIDIATNNLNGTLASGSTIRSVLVNTSIPKGVYFYQTQNASDNPESGALTTTMIYKNAANGNYSRVYAFCGNNIYYASTGSSVPTTLSWSKTTNTATACSATKGSSMPSGFPTPTISRRGNVCTVNFAVQFPAGTYSNTTDLWVLTPTPVTIVRVLLTTGTLDLMNITTDGKVRFNSTKTFSGTTWVIGSCTYLTDG